MIGRGIDERIVGEGVKNSYYRNVVVVAVEESSFVGIDRLLLDLVLHGYVTVLVEGNTFVHYVFPYPKDLDQVGW